MGYFPKTARRGCEVFAVWFKVGNSHMLCKVIISGCKQLFTDLFGLQNPRLLLMEITTDLLPSQAFLYEIQKLLIRRQQIKEETKDRK